jgi:hypothetical protein
MYMFGSEVQMSGPTRAPATKPPRSRGEVLTELGRKLLAPAEAHHSQVLHEDRTNGNRETDDVNDFKQRETPLIVVQRVVIGIVWNVILQEHKDWSIRERLETLR